MHPGVADAAKRDEVSRIVVRGVAVEVVDVEVLLTAADGAPVLVAFEDSVTRLLPSSEGILIPRSDESRESFAVDPAFAPRSKRALIAEPAEAVPVGMVGAEGGLRAVERIQAQLEVGAHGQIRLVAGWDKGWEPPPGSGECRGGCHRGYRYPALVQENTSGAPDLDLDRRTVRRRFAGDSELNGIAA